MLGELLFIVLCGKNSKSQCKKIEFSHVEPCTVVHLPLIFWRLPFCHFYSMDIYHEFGEDRLRGMCLIMCAQHQIHFGKSEENHCAFSSNLNWQTFLHLQNESLDFLTIQGSL